MVRMQNAPISKYVDVEDDDKDENNRQVCQKETHLGFLHCSQPSATVNRERILPCFQVQTES
jgi:hypothetical protein